MKLDHDLIRDILLYVEEIDNGKPMPINRIYKTSFHNGIHDIKSFKYHISYLNDTGYLKSTPGVIMSITPNGRHYAENVSNNDIWLKVKEKLADKLASTSMDIVFKVATDFVFRSLGH
jgi:Hypothetical protein (DUF2513).